MGIWQKNILCGLLILTFLNDLHGQESASDPMVNQDLFPIHDFLMDDQHSYVGFKIKYFGFSPVRGRFNQFRGHILYDTQDISKTTATVFIDVESINTGVEMRDNDLKGDHWFDSKQFPHIYFQSTMCQVQPSGFTLRGMLKIKDQTKEVSILFERPTEMSRDFAGNQQVDFSGRLKIKRSDFGVMGAGFWNSLMDGTLKQLSDEIDIELDIHCRRPDYLFRYHELEENNIRKILIDTLASVSMEEQQEILAPYQRQAYRDSVGLSSGALNTIGHTFLALEESSLARQIFELRAQWYPDASQSEVNLARVHAQRSEREETLRLLQMAIDKDSTNATALELMRQISID